MKNVIASILFLTFVGLASGQPVHQSNDYVLIFPVSGEGIAGNIVRIDPDTVVLFSNAFHYLAKKDIAKITIHPKQKPGQGFVIGSLTTSCALTYLLGTASGQPAPFLSNSTFGGGKYEKYSYSSGNGSLLGITFLGLLLGGGIGYVTDHSTPEDIVYIFDPRDPQNASTWAEVLTAIGATKRNRNYRLSISGGLVISTVQNKYYDQLAAQGYKVGENSYNLSSYSYQYDPPNDVNLIRSIAFSRRVSDHLEVGVAASWFGEPSYVSSLGYDGSYPPPNEYDKVLFGQRFEAKGYYATAAYSMFIDDRKDFEVVAGGGLGIATITLNLDAVAEHHSDKETVTTMADSYEFHKTTFSAMATAALSYYVYDPLSIGLSVNYFYGGSTTARAIPIAGIAEQPLVFGNFDIGLRMALHF